MFNDFCVKITPKFKSQVKMGLKQKEMSSIDLTNYVLECFCLYTYYNSYFFQKKRLAYLQEIQMHKTSQI